MLITFEGPDGSGKTTQRYLIEEWMVENNIDYVCMREPGGTEIGEQIRTVLHDTKNNNMSPQAEILLYSASRAQLVAERIMPALRDEYVVLLDRFFDSTFAYQGYGHGLDMQVLQVVTDFAVGGLRPNLTVFFDIPAEEGIARRLKAKDAEFNRLDAMALEFHRKVNEGYRQIIANDTTGRWVVIDGMRSIEEIQKDVRRVVGDKLEMAGLIERQSTGNERRR